MHAHFIFILTALLGAAIIHALVRADRSARNVAELILRYLLVGYCGVPMLAVSVWVLWAPDHAARAFGVTPGAVLDFFGWAYLGMSIIALLTLLYRGAYLVAPVVVWAIYLGGATRVHLHEAGSAGGHMHASLLEVFAAHGLIALLLLAALIVSGAWRSSGGKS